MSQETKVVRVKEFLAKYNDKMETYNFVYD